MGGKIWEITTPERMTGEDLNDQHVVCVEGVLVAGIQHAKIFSWQNTLGVTVMVHKAMVRITTPATAAAKINVGQAATEIESDDLIDSGALNAAGLLDNVDDKGTNGKSKQLVADDEWITGFEDNSAASTDLVGEYYIFYTKV